MVVNVEDKLTTHIETDDDPNSFQNAAVEQAKRLRPEAILTNCLGHVVQRHGTRIIWRVDFTFRTPQLIETGEIGFGEYKPDGYD